MLCASPDDNERKDVMGIHGFYSRLQRLYSDTDRPVSSWKEVAVLVVLGLPLLPLLMLVEGTFWLWFAVFTVWFAVSDVFFRLYRKRKTEKPKH